MATEATTNVVSDAANAVYSASGGVAGDTYSLEAHRLALTLLDLQHRIQQLTSTGNSGASPSCMPSPALPPPPPTEPPPAPHHYIEPDGRLHMPPGKGAVGFRRLRREFASSQECQALRSAMVLSMVGAFRRGGQTTLAVVPALRERFLAATGHDDGYVTLLQLLERVRATAASDDAEATAALQQPSCPVCGLREGNKKRSGGGSNGGSNDSSSSTTNRTGAVQDEEAEQAVALDITS